MVVKIYIVKNIWIYIKKHLPYDTLVDTYSIYSYSPGRTHSFIKEHGFNWLEIVKEIREDGRQIKESESSECMGFGLFD